MHPLYRRGSRAAALPHLVAALTPGGPNPRPRHLGAINHRRQDLLTVVDICAQRQLAEVQCCNDKLDKIRTKLAAAEEVATKVQGPILCRYPHLAHTSTNERARTAAHRVQSGAVHEEFRGGGRRGREAAERAPSIEADVE